MKNMSKISTVCFLMSVLLFYRGNAFVARAAEQNVACAAETDVELEQAAASDTDPEQDTESSAESEPESGSEELSGSGQTTMPDTEPEQDTESSAESEPESGSEELSGSGQTTMPDTDPEPDTESAAVPETEQAPESAATAAAEQTTVPAVDTVSTGEALLDWLESHKNTGGTVKLTDHVTLEGIHSICPNGTNMPAVTVDTGRYTITVAGEIELLSDDHLTFTGQPEGGNLFYVAQGGSLSMWRVAVESGQGALWQEEGAGLIVDNCHITGGIHYADTPYVLYYNPVCVVVDKDQTLQDVIPASINCIVNRRGETGGYESVSVSWNLTGTENQQEQRRRLQISGSFAAAASAEPVLCTAAYNDYPLTFTEVRAAATDSMYMFQGWYTKPEEALPITVMAEYSFDSVNWSTSEEKYVTDADDSFLIAFSAKQREAAHSDIYIRLRGNDSGREYLSNVLRYAADHLDCAEDVGGSRGGGTSIVNPPDPPEQDDPEQDDPPKRGDADTPTEGQPVQSPDDNTDAGDGGSEGSSDTNRTDHRNGSVESRADEARQPSQTEQPLQKASDTEAGQLPDTGSKANAGQSPDIGSDTVGGQSPDTGSKANAGQSPDTGAEAAVRRSSHTGSDVAGGKSLYEQPLYPDQVQPWFTEGNGQKDMGRGGSLIVLAAGGVFLSILAGIAGFYVHAHRRRAG